LLLNGTIPCDGSWLIVAIPINGIGLPCSRELNDFFHRLATTPLKRDASVGQRRSDIFKATEHETHTGGAENMGLHQRLIEHKQRDDLITLAASRRQRRLIVEPQIPSEPDNPAHQSSSCDTDFDLFLNIGTLMKEARRQMRWQANRSVVIIKTDRTWLKANVSWIMVSLTRPNPA
jgi:hypothetical protein